MDLGLGGKRALVTGSTKGIGRAIVETLLAEGASVALCARTEADVDAAVSELSAAGTVVGGTVDVADADSLTAWINSSA
ncbi:MAG: SDR family NAD(P)-dependent oxidoreductase, partial [Actinomycetota bacterium]